MSYLSTPTVVWSPEKQELQIANVKYTCFRTELKKHRGVFTYIYIKKTLSTWSLKDNLYFGLFS